VRAGNFGDLMMLPTGQGLRDSGIAAAIEVDDRREIVVKLTSIGAFAVGGGVDARRVCREIPAGQVEEMDRLFEDPVANAIDVVAPAAGDQAIGAAEELDQKGERLAKSA